MAPHLERNQAQSYLEPNMKACFQWCEDSNVKSKTIEVLEENMGDFKQII
jgi:hypothetical protein